MKRLRRDKTITLSQMMDDGAVDPRDLAMTCLCAMTEKQVEKMINNRHELSVRVNNYERTAFEQALEKRATGGNNVT